VFNFFGHIDLSGGNTVQHQFSVARDIMMKDLGLVVDSFDF
jgi:hypothetical protein